MSNKFVLDLGLKNVIPAGATKFNGGVKCKEKGYEKIAIFRQSHFISEMIQGTAIVTMEGD